MMIKLNPEKKYFDLSLEYFIQLYNSYTRCKFFKSLPSRSERQQFAHGYSRQWLNTWMNIQGQAMVRYHIIHDSPEAFINRVEPKHRKVANTIVGYGDGSWRSKGKVITLSAMQLLKLWAMLLDAIAVDSKNISQPSYQLQHALVAFIKLKYQELKNPYPIDRMIHRVRLISYYLDGGWLFGRVPLSFASSSTNSFAQYINTYACWLINEDLQHSPYLRNATEIEREVLMNIIQNFSHHTPKTQHEVHTAILNGHLEMITGDDLNYMIAASMMEGARAIHRLVRRDSYDPKGLYLYDPISSHAIRLDSNGDRGSNDSKRSIEKSLYSTLYSINMQLKAIQKKQKALLNKKATLDVAMRWLNK